MAVDDLGWRHAATVLRSLGPIRVALQLVDKPTQRVHRRAPLSLQLAHVWRERSAHGALHLVVPAVGAHVGEAVLVEHVVEIALEVFFGLLFAAGVAMLAVGGYVLFDVPDASDLSVPFWQVVAPAVLGFAVVGAVMVIAISRSFSRPQFAGREGMLGDVAVADSDIDPTGRVFLHGEYWNAVSDEAISAGESVEILSIDSLEVRVARVFNASGGES